MMMMMTRNQMKILYLINIHWLSVDFDWTRAGHAEGAILSCRMIVLPCDVISALKVQGSRGSPVFAPPTDWPISYELK